MIDKNFQDTVLACLVGVPEFAAVGCQYLSEKEFEGPLQANLAKMAIDFFNRYDTTITRPAFVHFVKQLVEKNTLRKAEVGVYAAEFKRINEIDTRDWQFTLERMVAFIKHQRIRAFINDAVKTHLPNENFIKIEESIQAIANISTDLKQEGYDYWDQAKIDERQEARIAEAMMKQVGISTGIQRMDQHLHKGGWHIKELIVVLAAPKRGKSMALLWFANSATLAGANVAHFTCEISKEVCATRLDAMNSDIPSDMLINRATKVAEAVAMGIPKGKLYLFEYPTKMLSVSEVKRQVKKIQLEKGVKIDMVTVDYLDIMKPNRFADDVLREQASIGEDLRGLAGEFKIPVVTASQVNRQGSAKSLITGRDIAGSWEKIMVADEIITLSATDEELANQQLRIHFSESRNSGPCTLNIKTAFERGRFYQDFIDDDY